MFQVVVKNKEKKPYLPNLHDGIIRKDTKWVIKSRKSKKDRQHNDQMKKDKRANNDLQNTTQKYKYCN